MKHTFELEIEPFSVNGMYSRDKRYKTTKYKHWEMRFFTKLGTAQNLKKLKALHEAYEPGDTFSVRMVFYYPGFYNKQGTISAHTEDLSNCEKVLLDCLFLEKYSRFPAPYGCKNIGTDDRFVTTLISQKKHTSRSKPYMLLSIRLNKHK